MFIIIPTIKLKSMEQTSNSHVNLTLTVTSLILHMNNCYFDCSFKTLVPHLWSINQLGSFILRSKCQTNKWSAKSSKAAKDNSPMLM
jgi:hypothetical protein